MKQHLREWGLAGVVGVVVLVGLLVEAMAGEVSRPPQEPPSGPRFVERALFCPPSLPDTKAILTAASQGEEPVSVGVEPSLPERLELVPQSLLVQQLPPEQGAEMVGFGAPVAGGALLRARAPVAGEGSSQCADRAADEWHFAAGASVLGTDERLLVYNPFPDEAVVRVSFLTAGAEIRKAALDDVAVPSHSVTFIRVNQYVRLQRVLAATVATERGRVVAWKVLFDKPKDGPDGVQMSLGVPQPETTWYFPEGAVTPGIDERIAIANPDPVEEAIVTVTLSTGEQVMQPEELVGMTLPPLSARVIPLRFSLPKNRRDLGGLSAIVQSTNDIGIVAERTIRYSRDATQGSTSEVGASRTSESWMALPATLNPSTDLLVLMNPGGNSARVDVTLLRRNGRPLTPAGLSGRRLASGGRLVIGLGRWTRNEAVAALVTSNAPIVVERVSYSAIPDDIGSVMGTPLDLR